MATIGQFNPNPISTSDPQGDFTAVVTPDLSEMVPNLKNRMVKFNQGTTTFFRGTVADHQGNEVVIEYNTKIKGIFLVIIVSPDGLASKDIKSSEAIEVVK
jgi:hypothetical protein